jgi:sugar fermentation stimulation protein A
MELLNFPEAFKVKIVKRLNRFVVLVEHDGQRLLAHNTNTGRLKELFTPQREAFCIPKKGKKTDCKLIAVKEKTLESFVLIETNLQMKAFEEAQKKGLINWLSPKRWTLVKRNALLGENSYIDYLFEEKDTKKKLYLEVKSAALRSSDGNYGMYPDCPTLRGQKHLREIINRPDQTGVLFICALKGVKGFKPHMEGDLQIYQLLKEAKKVGVPIKAISLYFDPQRKGVILENPDLDVVI